MQCCSSAAEAASRSVWSATAFDVGPDSPQTLGAQQMLGVQEMQNCHYLVEKKLREFQTFLEKHQSVQDEGLRRHGELVQRLSKEHHRQLNGGNGCNGENHSMIGSTRFSETDSTRLSNTGPDATKKDPEAERPGSKPTVGTPQNGQGCKDMKKEPNPLMRSAAPSGRKKKNLRHDPVGSLMNRLPFEVSPSLELCLRPAEKSLLYRAVHSGVFDTTMALAIIFNSIFIAIVTQWGMDNIGTAQQPGAFLIVDTVFCSVFTIELLLKMITERLAWIALDFTWNAFDAILVGFSLFDMISLLIPQETSSDSGGKVNLLFLRVLRVVRLFRVLRVVRVLRVFSGLRIMMSEIAGGLKSLFWMFLLLMFFLFIAAMAFMQGATHYLNDHAGAPTAKSVQISTDVLFLFPTLGQTLLTLFYVISGVESWSIVERTLRELSMMYSLIFVLFTFFVVFGVLNIVTAIFVDSTAECAQRDREEIIKNELAQKDDFIEELRAIFEETDSDNSGSITWAEFKERFETPEVLAYFSSLDLDTNEAEQLFLIMDYDGTGHITVDEFLNGIMRLKGGARKMDHLMLMDRVEKISKEVRDMGKLIRKCLVDS